MFKKIFKAIFVISGVLASVWKVFIKFHWHGQNTTAVDALSKLLKLFSGQTEPNKYFSNKFNFLLHKSDPTTATVLSIWRKLMFYKSPPSCLRAIPSLFFGVHELLEYSHTCMCDRCTKCCPGSGMGECVACQGQAWYTPISVPSSASPSWDENSNMPHRGQGWYLHFRSITLWPS